MTTATDSRPAEFLTVPEAARLLRVREATVRRLARRGELPALRVGSRWRIPIDSLASAAGSTTRRYQGGRD
jgi:excisionase family DNA binding protein